MTRGKASPIYLTFSVISIIFRVQAATPDSPSHDGPANQLVRVAYVLTSSRAQKVPSAKKSAAFDAR
jgi:hypothetical protein